LQVSGVALGGKRGPQSKGKGPLHFSRGGEKKKKKKAQKNVQGVQESGGKKSWYASRGFTR